MLLQRTSLRDRRHSAAKQGQHSNLLIMTCLRETLPMNKGGPVQRIGHGTSWCNTPHTNAEQISISIEDRPALLTLQGSEDPPTAYPGHYHLHVADPCI